jgi:hypothetical protein
MLKRDYRVEMRKVAERFMRVVEAGRRGKDWWFLIHFDDD